MSVRQSVIQVRKSASESVSRSVNHADRACVSRCVSQSVGQPERQFVRQSVCQSVSRSGRQAVSMRGPSVRLPARRGEKTIPPVLRRGENGPCQMSGERQYKSRNRKRRFDPAQEASGASARVISLSHRTCLSSRVARVNSRTNLSTYPLFLLYKG